MSDRQVEGDRKVVGDGKVVRDGEGAGDIEKHCPSDHRNVSNLKTRKQSSGQLEVRIRYGIMIVTAIMTSGITYEV